MSGVTNTLLTSIFLSFPEIVWILLVGFALMGIEVKTKNILFIAFIQAIVAFIVQALDTRFGLHTVIQTATLCILVTSILNIRIYRAAFSVMIGIFAQGVMQWALYSFATLIIPDLDVADFRVDFFFTFVYHIPIIILSILLLVFIKKKNITIL